MKPKHLSTPRYTAVMGLLFAAASVLNWLESLFSAALPAGMRVGLSNIVIMTAILALNLPSAVLLVCLKAVFVFLSRGFTAGMLSLSGSLLSLAVTALLFRRTKASYVCISVLGALSHSLGQLLAARLLMGTDAIFAYAPVLAVSSVLAGICTGLVLGTAFPQLKKALQQATQHTITKNSDQ